MELDFSKPSDSFLDVALQQCKDSKRPAQIYLMNGIKLEGKIINFSADEVVLLKEDNGGERSYSVIRKAAISTQVIKG